MGGSNSVTQITTISTKLKKKIPQSKTVDAPKGKQPANSETKPSQKAVHTHKGKQLTDKEKIPPSKAVGAPKGKQQAQQTTNQSSKNVVAPKGKQSAPKENIKPPKDVEAAKGTQPAQNKTNQPAKAVEAPRGKQPARKEKTTPPKAVEAPKGKQPAQKEDNPSSKDVDAPKGKQQTQKETIPPSKAIEAPKGKQPTNKEKVPPSKAIEEEEREAKTGSMMDMVQKFKGRICVRAPNERKTCFITGSAVLSEDRLVIVDNNNASVKLVNTRDKSLAATFKLSSEPRDVTVLSNLDALAVTLPEESKIQIFSTIYYNVLDELTSIITIGKCEGIEFLDGKLFVSFLFSSPSKVEIMTLDGAILKRITRDKTTGAPLFTWPDYLTVQNDSIFISNYWNSTVMKISKDGNVLNTYADKSLRWPRGLTSVGGGNVLVCSRFTHNLHLISSDCEKVGVLLSEKDGLHCPWSVCYCDAKKTLYVSSYSSQGKHGDYLRIYSFSDHDGTWEKRESVADDGVSSAPPRSANTV